MVSPDRVMADGNPSGSSSRRDVPAKLKDSDPES